MCLTQLTAAVPDDGVQHPRVYRALLVVDPQAVFEQAMNRFVNSRAGVEHMAAWRCIRPRVLSGAISNEAMHDVSCWAQNPSTTLPTSWDLPEPLMPAHSVTSPGRNRM